MNSTTWQPVSFRAEDRELVQIAIDECTRLGLGKYSPTGIVWTEKILPDRCQLSHNYLHLPQALNGRLRPEEWRPLIASAVLQREFVKRRHHLSRGMLLWFLFAYFIVIGSIIGGVVVARSLSIGPLSESVESALAWAFIGFVFSSGALLRLSNSRGQRLQADSLATDRAGKERLLQVLKRIGSTGFEANPRRIWTLFSSWPTLSQRIRNLEKAQQALSAKTEADQFEAFRKYLEPKP